MIERRTCMAAVAKMTMLRYFPADPIAHREKSALSFNAWLRNRSISPG